MQIVFIGSGNMAGSIIGGLVKSNWQADAITACDPDADKLVTLKAEFGINTSTNNRTACKDADIIVLAVKPQILKNVTLDLQGVITDNTVIISVAAGITTSSIKTWLNTDNLIVRTMPNTPSLIQMGMTGIYPNQEPDQNTKNIISDIFKSLGEIIWVKDEDKINVITAISGSGPAYFFEFFRAVSHAAQDLGMDQDTAARLIEQTALGAAAMALASDKDSETLRNNITSPGGTTEAALSEFARYDFSTMTSDAITAAYTRAQELAKISGA
jgi:pyrroline-5-carboxylate reductase